MKESAFRRVMTALDARIGEALRSNPAVVVAATCHDDPIRTNPSCVVSPTTLYLAPTPGLYTTRALSVFMNLLLPDFSPVKKDLPILLRRTLYDEETGVLNFGTSVYVEHMGTEQVVTRHELSLLSTETILREKLLQEGWRDEGQVLVYRETEQLEYQRRVEVVLCPDEEIAHAVSDAVLRNPFTEFQLRALGHQLPYDRNGIRSDALHKPKRGLLEILGLPI